jgi:hypothetical protein
MGISVLVDKSPNHYVVFARASSLGQSPLRGACRTRRRYVSLEINQK